MSRRVHLSAQIDPEIFDRLTARATSEKRTKGEIVESALLEYLEGQSLERAIAAVQAASGRMEHLADRVDRRHSAIERVLESIASFIVDVRRGARAG